jgi:seryl-tRNA synthetase
MASSLLALDEENRALQTELQQVLNERNQIAQHVGELKREGKEDASLLAQAAEIKHKVPLLEERVRSSSEALKTQLALLPNIPADDVPDGIDETDNQIIHTFKDKPSFSFTPKRHFEIGEKLGLMDFEKAGQISGSRFVLLKGALARLERALGMFMLDIHTQEFGYQEVSPPYLVRDEAVFGVGQLPKFGDDLFHTTDGRWLIPTAETSLTNLVREEILDASQLPLRFTAFTPCFRSEAGAAGRDTRGMIRQHQFSKVELVSITHPDQSAEEHERMTGAAEEILRRLDLPFRRVVLCTGDMSPTSRKTYDLEVWLAGEGAYREISSCSNCGDYQARRMNARCRTKAHDGKAATAFLHTLNGSGLAVGRTLVAILENYQQADGSVRIPSVLVPYMNNLEVIT